jgi:hypothetical protein
MTTAEPPIIAPQPAASPSSGKPSSGEAQNAKGAAAETGRPNPAKLEGKTEIDDKLSIECELLSYRAASYIADAIACELLRHVADDTTVVLVDEPAHAALHLQQAFVLQVELLEESFARAEDMLGEETLKAKAKAKGLEETVSKMVVPGLGAASAVAGSVLDFLGLFRADVSYKGRQTTVSQKALMLEIARSLLALRGTRKFQVFYPRLALFALGTEESASHRLIRQRLDPMLEVRARVEAALGSVRREVARRERAISDRLKRSRKRSEGEPLSPNTGLEKEIQEVLDLRLRMEAARKIFEQADAQLSAMWIGLQKPDEKSGRTGLQLLQEAEEMRARFRDKANAKANALMLHTEVVAAGGSYKIIRNLWRTLFWADGLRYSGGAVVAFAVFDADANVVIAGTHRYLEPHIRFPRARVAVDSINTCSPAPRRTDQSVECDLR